MFKVMASIKFGIDDSLYCEYSGIEHTTKEAADEELKKAELKEKNNSDIFYLKVEEY